MKLYRVEGGYTVQESYETYVRAENEKDAKEKASRRPVKDWDELQSFNDTGFIIDRVDEWE
jgi:hypothetical protein|tara:strand:- start:368 stop:550 length:183 start_codon:yes stop_codon:yes gene_type:complete